MDRRLILAFAGTAAFSFPRSVLADDTKLITFGLITDTHVCDKADQSKTTSLNATPRYFTGGLAKIEAFAQAMNKAGAAFVAELGDFTDNPADGSLPYEKKREAALGFVKAAESRLAMFEGPRYHVFGNHDTDQMTKEDFAALVTNTGITLAAGQYHYSWSAGGVHFVVLDAGYKADGAPYSGTPGTPGAGYSWDDANVTPSELDWLKADLAATDLPTIVFTHQELNPQEQIDTNFDPKHSVRQAAAIRSILEKSGRVLAVFSGHYHDGGYQEVNGIHYVVLQASTAYGNSVAYHNQFALVDVRHKGGKDYRVSVLGNGVQKSYILDASMR